MHLLEHSPAGPAEEWPDHLSGIHRLVAPRSSPHCSETRGRGAIRQPMLKQPRHGRTVGLRAQEQGDALHGQAFAVVDQDVVTLKANGKSRVLAGLELDVDDPGVALFDQEHRVSLGGDCGEVHVQDANVAELAAQQQLRATPVGPSRAAPWSLRRTAWTSAARQDSSETTANPRHHLRRRVRHPCFSQRATSGAW